MQIITLLHIKVHTAKPRLPALNDSNAPESRGVYAPGGDGSSWSSYYEFK